MESSSMRPFIPAGSIPPSKCVDEIPYVFVSSAEVEDSFVDCLKFYDIFEGLDDFYPSQIDYPAFLDATTTPQTLRQPEHNDFSSSEPNRKRMRTEDTSSSVSYAQERREKNREHAKQSRNRKKVLLDTLHSQLSRLRSENMSLRGIVEKKLPHLASTLLSECTTVTSSLLSSAHHDADDDDADAPCLPKASPDTSICNKPNAPKKQTLVECDYRLIHSLMASQQNFVLSDPNLPDNPIVYASPGFCKMTGYKANDVVGRNCRFLQGPNTDQKAIDVIRGAVREGRDVSVCLLNYKANGQPFWNQFFMAALTDIHGRVVNFVGVQCEVNNVPVAEMRQRVRKLPLMAPSDR